MIRGTEILKNEGITNHDITKHLGHLKNFNGVFAHDMLPTLSKKTINFGVVNYHNRNQPGSHWVAYYYDPKQTYTKFFDSYGLPPSNNIKKFLLSFGKPLTYNAKMIQATNSNRCGWYTIYFILASYKENSFYDIISHFDSNGKMFNDKILMRLLN